MHMQDISWRLIVTLLVEQKLDDSFKTIVGVKGFKNEVSQKVVDTPKLG